MSVFYYTGLLFFFSLLTFISSKNYDGYKVIHVVPETPVELSILYTLWKDNNSSYEFLSMPSMHRSCRIIMHPEKVPDFLSLMKKSATVINENFGQGIEEEIRSLRLLRISQPFRKGQRLGTNRYYSHDEINSYITDLAQRFPKRAFVQTLGASYEGRTIKTITITNGDDRKNKNVILIDGGFHAREWISPASAVYIIGQLVENFEENADLLRDYDWVILPVVNPDGYEYTQVSPKTRMWRKTRKPNEHGNVKCYGTDPNRNFDFHWNEVGTSPYPCDDTYAGSNAFSEPETIIVRNLMHSLQGRGVMYLTLHSFGSQILYPWGYAHILPDTWKDLDEVAMAGANAILNATGTEFEVGCSACVIYAVGGASDDYAFSSGFPIVFTMELTEGGENGFDPPPTSIDSYVKETWTGVRAMAEKVIKKYPPHL